MGLFSSKTIITVASTVYNLAGDEKDRPNYLQTLIVKNVLSGTRTSLGDDINAGYLKGPGIKFRTFFRWALKNYDEIGMPTGQMFAGDTVPTGDVADQIPHTANENVWVQEARLADSDYEMWAEQWMLENHPELFSTEWEADMDDITKTIHIKFEETTPATPDASFVAADFIPGEKYIFAYYTKSETGVSDPVVIGSPVLLGSDPFPSVTDYDLDTDNTTPRTETLAIETTVVKHWSDGRPDETSHTTSSEDVTVNRRVRVYEMSTYVGNDPDSDAKITRKDIRRLITDKKVVTSVTTDSDDVDIGGGVTRTTTTIVTEDELEQDNRYRDDTQKVYEQKWSQIKVYIYRIGTGNIKLDKLVKDVADYGKFFPMIPFRLDNKFISEKALADTDNVDPDWDSIYELAKKALKKGTNGGKYSKIEGELKDSDDIGDMDYIYAVYGVSLNCLDRSARRYIYDFFKRLQNDQTGGNTSGTQFSADMAAYTAAYNVWLVWKNSNNTSGSGSGGVFVGNPAPEPPLPAKPTLPNNEIKIQALGESGGVNLNYDIRISWNFISEGGEHAGLGKAKARKNDVWIEYRGKTTINSPTYVDNTNYGDHGYSGPVADNTIEYDSIRIYWQFEKNQYRYIDVAGLVHKNYVYGGKNVTISAKEALEDGEESGFLIPLHYATFRAMPLVHSTQMTTACVFLVINCYQKKKQKWWQRGIFKILFVIAIAIIAGFFAPGAIGLLGSNIAVGSAIGLTGTAAAIVGSVANALAALVLTTIIQKVTANMGIFGAILGAVLGIVIGGAISNFSSGAGFTFNFSDLMRADNIMKLLDAAGQGYSAYVQASINSMQDQLVKLQEETNSALRDIRQQYVDQFGSGGGQIDPAWFMSSNSPAKNPEMRDTFLARTLMTGSDVAGMSMDLLNNMADLTLSLPNAFNA